MLPETLVKVNRFHMLKRALATREDCVLPDLSSIRSMHDLFSVSPLRKKSKHSPPQIITVSIQSLMFLISFLFFLFFQSINLKLKEKP